MVEAMTIRLEVEGPVAVATLSRPDKLNALSTQVVAELTTVTERLVADPAVRVLVLAAEGRMFSAGADIDEFRDAFGRGDIDPAGTEAEARAGRRLTSALADPGLVTIAAVHGGGHRRCRGAGRGVRPAGDGGRRADRGP